jgi:hypothetical protein
MSKLIDAEQYRSSKFLGGETYKAIIGKKPAHGSILVTNPTKKANLTMAGSKSKVSMNRKV